MENTTHGHNLPKFSKYQIFVIAILVFLQFTIILDFMIISPLGAILMPALKISPAQFGLVVSVYAFSAGLSGFLSAGFADRYDRKKLLLFFYTGFILGTLFCGMAPNYNVLLIARMVTGLFGGVIGSIVLAITTDLFSFQMRGRVMGFLQTAFAASQIIGLPAGLYFSNLWGWHSPFIMIVLLGALVGTLIFFYLKPIDEHLKIPSEKRALLHLWHTLKEPNYILAYATTGLLSLGGFMIMPFASDYTVNNLGIHLEKLPMIYLVTGIATIFIGPFVGKASDTFGKFNVFLFGVAVSIIMVIIYTNLGITPLIWVMIVNVVMFVGIFSRMIPSQALISVLPTPDRRGAFMAVSSSLQQLAGGLASLFAGYIVVEKSDGALEHFDTLGYVMVVIAIISALTMYQVHRSIPEPSVG